MVRDIQNTQCLLNVEHLRRSCPACHPAVRAPRDVGLGLVKEGLVMVEVRKEKQFQRVVRAVGGRDKSGLCCGGGATPRPREGGCPREPVKEQGPTILLLLQGKDNGFGFVGGF